MKLSFMSLILMTLGPHIPTDFNGGTTILIYDDDDVVELREKKDYPTSIM